jgi:hypothetical protein
LHSVIGQLGPGCSVSDLEIQRNGPGWLLFTVSKGSISRFSISIRIGTSSNRSTAIKCRPISTWTFVHLFIPYYHIELLPSAKLTIDHS